MYRTSNDHDDNLLLSPVLAVENRQNENRNSGDDKDIDNDVSNIDSQQHQSKRRHTLIIHWINNANHVIELNRKQRTFMAENVIGT